MVVNISSNRYDLSFLIILTILCLVFGILLGLLDDVIVFDEINTFALLSVVMFIITTCYACISDKHLSLVLPFMLIAFPTSFDNIIPGVYLENAQMGVVYPLFCHPELFLLIILATRIKRIKDWKTDRIPFVLMISFLFSSIANLFCHFESQYMLLLIAGLYPVRLLILIVLTVRNVELDFDKIFLGICLTIFFLALESLIFTKMRGLDVLTSGSLGNNTFGNVMGQLTCVLIFYLIVRKGHCNKRRLFLFSIIVGLVCTLGTGTRMALLAILIMLLVVVFPKLSTKVKLVVCTFVAVVVLYFVRNDVLANLTGKFDVNAAFSAIDYSESSGLNVGYSEATTSLMTRLNLWEVSMNMFLDKPLTGIGWNLFNVLKYHYGFDIDVIIDPHNGYLSFLSQLGVWSFFWIYFLFYRSWKIFRCSDDMKLKILALFNMGMTICELTNAGSYKYNVLPMLLFVSVYINYHYKLEQGGNLIQSRCYCMKNNPINDY